MPVFRLWAMVFMSMSMAAVLTGCSPPESKPTSAVSSHTCGGCHQPEYQLWQKSHHFQAMHKATAEFVLADFAGQSVDYAGLQHRFFKEGEQFRVETENASGELETFTITETFGWQPLQQYLVSFADGRKQVLPFAWDSRPVERGGQRWITIYQEPDIRAGDPLHWLGVYMNWNSSCASCHSTGYAKNYDASGDRYHSVFDEINVGCEACHGSGKGHLQWVADGSPDGAANGGFAVNLASGANWLLTPGAAIATPDSRPNQRQLETCAHCHSRRSDLMDFSADSDFHKVHQLELLEPGLYFPDGQIQDEVYVYGSFLQSKMHHAGVVCSDCHEPHSGQLRAGGGNNTCQQCHSAEQYGPNHSRHMPGSAGNDCANCHMPHRTYMVVDDRRDHSIRIPRPDLTLSHGVPNACNQCHSDQTAQWAVDSLAQWGVTPPQEDPAMLAISSLRQGDVTALNKVKQLVQGGAGHSQRSPHSPLVRATGLEALSRYIRYTDLQTLRENLEDGDELVRYGAVKAAAGLQPAQVVELLWPRLDDSAEAVRRQALEVLLQQPGQVLDADKAAQLQQQAEQLLTQLAYNADRPDSQFQTALLLARLQRFDKAEQAYLNALKINPQLVPALVNLADLYRQKGRDDLAEQQLKSALQLVPTMPQPTTLWDCC